MRVIWRPATGIGGWIFLLLLTGCEGPKGPPPQEYRLMSPYPAVKTLAVAPVVNLSGSRDFDSLSVADQVFGELQQVGGLNVLPVNKTLAAMQKLGLRTIDSAQAAQNVVEALGADALVVTAVTAYDPYKPPTIGMSMQVYTARGMGEPTAATEPAARQIDGGTLPGDPEPPRPVRQPVSEVAAMFNAHNQTVLAELREFAQGRTNYESALQEERFLADSDAYTRFVCHAMVRRLLEVERVRIAGR